MKKLGNLTLSGVFLIFAGVSMLIAEKIGLKISIILVPVFFGISGVLCFLFSKVNKEFKVPSQFQLLQGLGLITYAIVIFLFPISLLQFLIITSYFIMLFGIIEIAFSFLVLNSSSKTLKEPLLFRMIGGFCTAFGALILVLTSFKNEYNGIQVAGFLTIIIGVSNIIFASKISKLNHDYLA